MGLLLVLLVQSVNRGAFRDDDGLDRRADLVGITYAEAHIPRIQENRVGVQLLDKGLKN